MVVRWLNAPMAELPRFLNGGRRTWGGTWPPPGADGVRPAASLPGSPTHRVIAPRCRVGQRAERADRVAELEQRDRARTGDTTISGERSTRLGRTNSLQHGPCARPPRCLREH